MLSFHRSELNRQQPIMYFFKTICLGQQLNFNKLLLFNIYETHLLQVMWTLCENDKLTVALVVRTSGWTYGHQWSR